MAGTVTLSEMKCTTRTGLHVHLYTRLFSRDNFGQRGYFDTGLFYNTEEFTMRFNEQHKMLMQSASFDRADSTIYHARLDGDEFSIDIHQEPGQLCYVITLLTPDVTLTVGPKTSLSLLLKSAQLHVTTYMVTEEQATQLKRPLQERDLVRSQVNSIQTIFDNNQPGVNVSDLFQYKRRDSRKRKAPVDIPSGPYVPYRPCSPTTTPPPSLFNI
mgnify:FL=1